MRIWVLILGVKGLMRKAIYLHYATITRCKPEKTLAKSCGRYICGILLHLNRPYPSSWIPHFQNEAKCSTFLVKMSFISMKIKNHFHIKGWELNLVLKHRPGGTRKWPIVTFFTFVLHVKRQSQAFPQFLREKPWERVTRLVSNNTSSQPLGFICNRECRHRMLA